MSSLPDKNLRIVAPLKLLLILTVVLSHSKPCTSQLDPTQWGAVICNVFAGMMAFNLGVPGFFLVSGYLFFSGVRELSKNIYFEKLRRRVRTLLIPYVIWDIFCCGLFLFKAYFLNKSSLGIIEPGGNIDMTAFLQGFIAIPAAQYMPYAFAFWFIRNLIVIVILSPLALAIARRWWAIATMLVLTIVIGNELYGFEFFTLGAAAAIRNFKPSRLKIKPIYSICAILTAFATEYGMQFIHASQPYVFLRYIVFALLFTAAVNIALRPHHEHLIPIGSTFFIYAFHQCFITITSNFWMSIIGTSTSLGAATCLLLDFATLLGVSVAVWACLRRICPRFLAVITGGRS